MPEEGKEPPRSGLSTRGAVIVAAAILVLLPLALWCALLVASVRETHAVLEGSIELDIWMNAPNEFGVDGRWDFLDPSRDAKERVRTLGGRARAARRLSFYLRLPEWIAPAGRKCDAAVLLGYCGEAAMPALIDTLRGPDPAARLTAVISLGRIGPPAKAAVEALEKRLDEPDPNVRLTAAIALWRITGRHEKLTAEIDRSLSEANEWVCTYAAIAIGKIGPEAKAAVPGLVAILQNRLDSPPGDIVTWEWVPYGVRALGQIGPAAREAIPVLERYAKQESLLGSPSMGEAAAALKKIRGGAAENASP